MRKSPSKVIPGINMQWPWSVFLLDGEKTVETRSYPLPEKYRNQPLAMIETPGPRGKKEAGITEARITGIITFSDSFQYKTRKQWLADRNRHCVAPDDPHFGFKLDKEKWGWVVASVEKFERPLLAPKKRGIVFATACEIL